MNHELTRRLKEWLEEDRRLAAHLVLDAKQPAEREDLAARHARERDELMDHR